MKKYLSIVALLMLGLVGFTSCGDDDDEKDVPETTSNFLFTFTGESFDCENPMEHLSKNAYVQMGMMPLKDIVVDDRMYNLSEVTYVMHMNNDGFMIFFMDKGEQKIVVQECPYAQQDDGSIVANTKEMGDIRFYMMDDDNSYVLPTEATVNGSKKKVYLIFRRDMIA